jgi:hypothetical protein
MKTAELATKVEKEAAPKGLNSRDLVKLADEIRRQFVGASADAALIAAAQLLNTHATLRAAGIGGLDDEEVLRRTISDHLANIANALKPQSEGEAS